LRRGKLVGTRPTAELDNDTMAEMMVGRRETRATVERAQRAPGNPVLQVETLAGQRHAEAGVMKVHGERYMATRPEMIRHKIACLPEEPLRNACVAEM